MWQEEGSKEERNRQASGKIQDTAFQEIAETQKKKTAIMQGGVRAANHAAYTATEKSLREDICQAKREKRQATVALKAKLGGDTDLMRRWVRKYEKELAIENGELDEDEDNNSPGSCRPQNSFDTLSTVDSSETRCHLATQVAEQADHIKRATKDLKVVRAEMNDNLAKNSVAAVASVDVAAIAAPAAVATPASPDSSTH